ncbi:MAG: hypothetical protein AB1648_05560, partial [Pseudomonadota bacterium]
GALRFLDEHGGTQSELLHGVLFANKTGGTNFTAYPGGLIQSFLYDNAISLQRLLAYEGI